MVGPKDKPLDEYTRKYIDSLEETAKTYGAKGLAWAKVGPDGTLSGGISKYLVGLEKELVEMFGAKEGDVILFIAHGGENRLGIRDVFNAVSGLHRHQRTLLRAD